MNEQLPDFTGKSVVFYITSSSTTPNWLVEGIVLESPSFQKQGDRLFIVGQTPSETERESEGDWTANREAGILWESVFHYIVIPSEEYYAIKTQPSDGKAEVAEEKKPIYKYLIGLFIATMSVLIPVTLLIALIVWIIKML